jgi:hypothetical protein
MNSKTWSVLAGTVVLLAAATFARHGGVGMSAAKAAQDEPGTWLSGKHLESTILDAPLLTAGEAYATRYADSSVAELAQWRAALDQALSDAVLATAEPCFARGEYQVLGQGDADASAFRVAGQLAVFRAEGGQQKKVTLSVEDYPELYRLKAEADWFALAEKTKEVETSRHEVHEDF